MDMEAPSDGLLVKLRAQPFLQRSKVAYNRTKAIVSNNLHSEYRSATCAYESLAGKIPQNTKNLELNLLMYII